MKPILVVRKYDEFSRILEKNGFEPINFPTIETAELEDLSDFEVQLENIETFDGIFLTSAVASEIFLKKMRQFECGFRGKIYVLGKRSRDLLRKSEFDLYFDETANTADEILRNIPPDALKNKRFLFVRGEKSLRTVPNFLEKHSSVSETIVYRTNKAAPEIDKIKAIGERIEKNEIICACFFSPSGAEGFLEHFDEQILHQIKTAVIGKTTANYFEKRNLTVDFVSSKATAEDFAFELIKRLKNGKRKA